MKAIGIVGFSNSGKTTLISRLSECLEARGLQVAIAKHTHHALDKPDTDTALLMKPGRTIVGLSHPRSGGGEAMLLWGRPRYLSDIVPLLEADVLLVEGGKTLGWLPRILCLRQSQELMAALPAGLSQLNPDLAIASYGEIPFPGLKAYTAEELDALVDLILERGFLLPGLDCGACGEADCAGLARRIVAGQATPEACVAADPALELSINGHPVGLNPFTRSMLGGSIRGMLSSLKGTTPGGEIVIRMKETCRR